MTDDLPGAARRPPPGIDSTVPHSARVWNYWLGGNDNYPVDRAAGERYLEAYPQIADVAREIRYFLARAVRYLADAAGIRQFLDVGTGLPTVCNTHEIAQRVAPHCRVVYVDNDPLVLVHARALLTSSPEGACDYVDADLHEPANILDVAARTLDLARPVAPMLLGVLGHVSDYDEARSVVSRLMDGLPSGSYLTIADSINASKAHDEARRRYSEGGAIPYHLRTRDQIARFTDGLDLVDPGLVPVSRWRPDPSPFGLPAELETLCVVARKP